MTDNVFSVGVKEEGDTPSLSFMNGSVFFGRDGRTIICNGRFEMQPNGDAEIDNGEIKMSIEGREFRVRRYQEVRSGDVIQEVEERLFDVSIDDDGKRYLTFAKGGRSQNGSTPEAVTALFSVDDDGTPTFGDVPGARTNLGVPSLTNGGSYWGLGFPDGTNVGYMRTPSSGLIPRMEGGVENTYLGTSGWPFYQCHAKEFYGMWNGNPLSWSDLDTGVQDFVNNASFSAHARTTDLNPLMNGVKWWGSGCANIPSGESYGIVATFSNGTDPKSTGLWRRQIALSTTGRTYTRQCINCPATTASTSWTSWVRIWDLSSILPASNGGTGITSNPSMLVNLGSTSAASVFQTSPRPGVTGTLPLSRGGLGATTAAGGRSTLGLTKEGIYSEEWVAPLSYISYPEDKIQFVRRGTSVTCTLPGVRMRGFSSRQNLVAIPTSYRPYNFIYENGFIIESNGYITVDPSGWSGVTQYRSLTWSVG